MEIDEIFNELQSSRANLRDLLKQKKYFAQSEYEELRAEAERIKQKYANLNEELRRDIIELGQKNQRLLSPLYNGGFISIEQFANEVSNILSSSTMKSWEIVAIAFTYKKRVKTESGLSLVPTEANIIGVAKVGAFSNELTEIIFGDKNWLGNNQAMLGFIEMINKGDIILLHIVEQENRAEKMLNLFESGFNGDFDKYLLRFELDYNEKNPIHKYPILMEYMDKYVYQNLTKKK